MCPTCFLEKPITEVVIALVTAQDVTGLAFEKERKAL